MLIKLNNRTLKFLLLFLTLFALQMAILFVLLLRPQISSAASIGVRAVPDEKHSNCPCSDKYTPPTTGVTKKVNETIRLFIPIPGVTDACGYLCDINGDKKGNVVDYVVAIYKFLVGAAAIMAVFMIMVGGYQWIFAMGSSSAIESAKDTIKSALFGLLLTLFSYQVLHFINPRLTDVVLPDVEEIGRLVQGDILCNSNDILTLVPMGADSSNVNLKIQVWRDQVQKYKDNPQTVGQPLFSFDSDFSVSLHWGDERISMLRCDNFYEMKIARISVLEGKLAGVDCFFDLCNEQINKDAWAFKNQLLTFIQDRYTDLQIHSNDPKLTFIKNSTLLSINTQGAGCYGGMCNVPPFKNVKYPMCIVDTGASLPLGCASAERACKAQTQDRCEMIDNILAAQQTPFNQYGCIPRQSSVTSGGVATQIGFGVGAAATAAIVGGLIIYTVATGGVGLIPVIGLWLGIGAAGTLGGLFGDDIADTLFPQTLQDCAFGPELHCPVGWTRVDPQLTFKEPTAENVCWTKKQNPPTIVASCGTDVGEVAYLSTKVVHKGPMGICCQQDDLHKFKCQKALDDGDFLPITTSGIDSDGDGQINCPKGNECDNLPTADSTIKWFCRLLDTTTIDNDKFCLPDKGQLCYVYNADNARFYYKTKQACDDHTFLHDSLETNPKHNCILAVVPSDARCSDVVYWGEDEYKTGGGPNPYMTETGAGKVLAMPGVQQAFNDAATEIHNARSSYTEHEALSLLYSLAMVESGWNPADVNGKVCGLMQVTLEEARKYDDGELDGLQDGEACDKLIKEPDLNVKIAGNNLVAMFNDTSKVCAPTYDSRSCIYSLVDPNSSPCKPIMDIQNPTLTQKESQIFYLYAAYNGGAGANCNNQTYFFTDACLPPKRMYFQAGNELFCPGYATKQGSIWECDGNSQDYKNETRPGTARMADCFNVYNKQPVDYQVGGCCGNGRDACIVNQCITSPPQ